jgi:2-keto-4-pentenoate hydratase/2-oxohepta-3-ene-1,7-dioic acid hydratase in catechol pathway
MKLVTFRRGGEPRDRVGVLYRDAASVVDLSEHFPTMLALIDGGEVALDVARREADAARSRFALGDVALRAPIPEPRQLRDAMTFERHFQQSIDAIARMRVGPLAPLARALGIAKIPRVWYEQPTYYKCNRFSVIGTETDVVWPTGARLLDYECELAVVIGTRGKDIPKARALDHVFGYTIYNDMTARDLQIREMRGHLGPAKGKDFDTGNVLGPWLVTKDEIPDPHALTMISRVNGVEQGRGSSADMYHRWDDVIAYISQNETLHPGEIIGSGTVGNGCGLERGRFLEPGSVVELEITGLGTLRNRLVKA